MLNFDLKKVEEHLLVEFVDFGVHPQLRTTYEITLLQKGLASPIDSRVLLATEVLDENQRFRLPLEIRDWDQDYVLDIKVKREGLALANEIEFSLSGEHLGNFDTKPYLDHNRIGGIAVHGSGTGTEISFLDNTENRTAVKTQYRIKITRPSGFLWLGRTEMATKIFERSAVDKQGNGRIRLSLAEHFGISANELKSHFTADYAEIIVHLQVIRTSSRINGGKSVTIEKEKRMKLFP